MTEKESDTYDESEHCKEVYARFGLAYYQSGVIESGIANALMLGEFLTAWKVRIEREGKANFDRKVYESEFDAYLENQFAQTFGNLVARLDRIYGIPVDLKDALSECKKKRDHLAHRYFRERSTDFVTREGRDRMIRELSELTEKFHETDRRVNEMQEPVMEKLGIRKDMLNQFTAEFMKKAYAGEPV